MEGQAESAAQPNPVEQPAEAPTQQADSPVSEETFFDPKSIQDKPELMAAYKQMQSAYTKKTQAIAADRRKIEAFNQFERDPVSTIRQLAQQYGVSFAQAQQIAEQQHEDQQQQWEPKTWDEVIAKAKESARTELLQELQPVIGEFQNIKKSTIEKQLDETCPDWRTYEDEMVQMLKDHPTLANNPEKLYRLAVPENVFEARYTQRAIEKMKKKVDNSAISGGSGTNKPVSSAGQKVSFREAFEMARNELMKR